MAESGIKQVFLSSWRALPQSAFSYPNQSMSLPTEETSGRQSPERTCSRICSSSSTQLLSSELKGELTWVCWHFDRRSTRFSDSKYLLNPFISSLIAKVALFLIPLLLQTPQYCIFKILLNQSFIKMLQWLKIKSKILNRHAPASEVLALYLPFYISLLLQSTEFCVPSSSHVGPLYTRLLLPEKLLPIPPYFKSCLAHSISSRRPFFTASPQIASHPLRTQRFSISVCKEQPQKLSKM